MLMFEFRFLFINDLIYFFLIIQHYEIVVNKCLVLQVGSLQILFEEII